jgi:hypothetical protein
VLAKCVLEIIKAPNSKRVPLKLTLLRSSSEPLNGYEKNRLSPSCKLAEQIRPYTVYATPSFDDEEQAVKCLFTLMQWFAEKACIIFASRAINVNVY